VFKGGLRNVLAGGRFGQPSRDHRDPIPGAPRGMGDRIRTEEWEGE
jgi:hypothetical protein